jgi:hypothetical protein
MTINISTPSLPKNWKTSVAGVVTAFFGFVVASPETFSQVPWLVTLAKYAVAGGLASMGLLGKDYNSHSTVAETQAATASATAATVAEEVKK